MSYQKDRRRKLKELGLCVSCGKIPPRLNKTTCESCGKNQSISVSKWKSKIRQDRYLNGLCSCGRKAVTGRKTCDGCNKKNLAAYYQKKSNGKCSYCANDAKEGQTRCEECGKKIAARNRKLRLEAYEAYGGARCKCCGENIEQFLTIDHMNDDGAEHRQEIGRTSIIGWLKKNNYPEGFQVLCFNCNEGRRFNGGVCPHQKGSP